MFENDEILLKVFEKIKTPMYNLISECCYIEENTQLRVYLINVLDLITDLALSKPHII